MWNSFMPDAFYESVECIPIELLKQWKIALILLDIDGTIIEHDSNDISKNIKDWILFCSKQIPTCFVSNNSARRVGRIAEQFKLDYCAKAKKPLHLQTRKLIGKYEVEKDKIVIIGDHLFNDILCSKMIGTKSILVKTLKIENRIDRKIQRSVENMFIKNGKNYENKK